MNETHFTANMFGGTYTASSEAFGAVIDRHLPASTNQLRQTLTDISPEIDYSQHNMAECLMILADFETARIANWREFQRKAYLEQESILDSIASNNEHRDYEEEAYNANHENFI